MKYAKCQETYEDIQKYRNDEGFIDLGTLDIIFDNQTREQMGNEQREKNWIQLGDGKKFLAKESIKYEGKDNGSIYSELLISELADQVGLQHANCDLYEKDGKRGILSENILSDDEEMFSLNFFVGDNNINSDYIDITDFFKTGEKLINSLIKLGCEKSQIKQLLVELQKQFVFDSFVCESDRHTENISLVVNSKTGEYRLSPMYDNENSLLLDNNLDLLKEMTSKPSSVKDASDMIYPKIALMPPIDNPSAGEIWKYTFDQMIGDDEVYDFAMDCFEKLDITKAIKNVEKKICCPIPYEVSCVASLTLEQRRKTINDIMLNGIDYDSPKEIDHKAK